MNLYRSLFATLLLHFDNFVLVFPRFRDLWYVDYTSVFLVPYCHSFYLGILGDVFEAIKEKIGLGPFRAIDKVIDNMALTTDFNRQLKHCVGSSSKLFPCYTCEDYLNFVEVIMPAALCMNGLSGYTSPLLSLLRVTL